MTQTKMNRAQRKLHAHLGPIFDDKVNALPMDTRRALNQARMQALEGTPKVSALSQSLTPIRSALAAMALVSVLCLPLLIGSPQPAELSAEELALLEEMAFIEWLAEQEVVDES